MSAGEGSKSFVDAVGKGERGFVVKNSVFLPFHFELISIWAGKEMSLLAAPELMVDFCDAPDIGVREGRSYTNLVFRKWKNIQHELGHHKGHIVIHAAEKGADLFDKANLHYIRISFRDDRKELQFELIDNPFEL
ncbi:MAG: hypothetical protein HGB36_13505 [Chlorobiaceae bacterium]|nr:hypothetical protein [Chlorobiaceae bacterium]